MGGSLMVVHMLLATTGGIGGHHCCEHTYRSHAVVVGHRQLLLTNFESTLFGVMCNDALASDSGNWFIFTFAEMNIK